MKLVLKLLLEPLWDVDNVLAKAELLLVDRVVKILNVGLCLLFEVRHSLPVAGNLALEFTLIIWSLTGLEKPTSVCLLEAPVSASMHAHGSYWEIQEAGASHSSQNLSSRGQTL